METAYHGFFVGPLPSSEVLDAAADKAAVKHESLLERGGVWALLQAPHPAEQLVRQLGVGSWLWEVELSNDVGDDADGENRGESHSGMIRGSRLEADGGLQLRVEDPLWEEGYILGGVMAEVAFEYAREYARAELEADAGRVNIQTQPSNATGPMLRRAAAAKRTLRDLDVAALTSIASELIDHLLATGDLEVVNHHAQSTLVEPLEACMSASATVVEAASRMLQALEDATEVVEIYASEAEVEAFLQQAI